MGLGCDAAGCRMQGAFRGCGAYGHLISGMLFLFFAAVVAAAIHYTVLEDGGIVVDTLAPGDVKYYSMDVSNSTNTVYYVSGNLYNISGDSDYGADVTVFVGYDEGFDGPLINATFFRGLWNYYFDDVKAGHQQMYFAVAAPSTKGASWGYLFSMLKNASIFNVYKRNGLLIEDYDLLLALFTLEGLIPNGSFDRLNEPVENFHYKLIFFTENQLDDLVYLNELFLAVVGADHVEMNQTILVTSRGIWGSETAGWQFQIYVDGLETGGMYLGYMAYYNDPDDALQGGRLYRSFAFNTSIYDNCRLIYNLSLCLEVAYSVPVLVNNNGDGVDLVELAREYDRSVLPYWEGFTYALQQASCDAPNDEKYLVFSTCDNCASSYKAWLCSTMIPRCSDRMLEGYFPVDANSTVNSTTLEAAMDYIQVPPCIDMCHSMVKYCPSALFLFICPDLYSRRNQTYSELLDDAQFYLYALCLYTNGSAYNPTGWNLTNDWAHAIDASM